MFLIHESQGPFWNMINFDFFAFAFQPILFCAWVTIRGPYIHSVHYKCDYNWEYQNIVLSNHMDAVGLVLKWKCEIWALLKKFFLLTSHSFPSLKIQFFMKSYET